jgi:uncharacterized Ntn-hydrolase superfamily protein
MTWSVVAFDESTGAFGVAVSTRAFAVGARCPFVRAGVGAVCTQSITNAYLGPRVLDLLENGVAPAEAVELALAPDEGRHLRQIHAVDREGRSAAWTGENCVEWAGHKSGSGFSVAGNMLAGEAVVRATFDAYAASPAEALPERLLAALAAGEAAGGDKRGKQAAALRIHGDEDYPSLDLRVDDHEEPILELRRLHDKSLERFQPFIACLPGRRDPVGLLHRDEIEARVEAFVAERAARGGPGLAR